MPLALVAATGSASPGSKGSEIPGVAGCGVAGKVSGNFNLICAGGRARVGRRRRGWAGRKPRLQTCLRRFGRLEQAMPLTWLRPACRSKLRGETTTFLLLGICRLGE